MLFQIMVYAVLFFLFIVTGFAKPQAEPQNDRHPTRSSLVTIAGWVSANSDLPNADEPPRVELVPPAELQRLRYKGLLPHQWQVVGGEHSTPRPEYQRKVVAVYDDATATIYLPDSWTGSSPADESVLVHEMVHHLQNRAGLKYECNGAREKSAYLAQKKWLEAHGLNLEDEFQVDMFTIVTSSSCMY